MALLSALCVFACNGIVVAWIYAIGINLHQDDSERAVNFRTRLKQLCLWDMVSCILWMLALALAPFSGKFFIYLAAMHALVAAWLMYVVSREFIYFEREGKGVFIETMGVFFHIYYFAYGIWFFQPRMQALMKKLEQTAGQVEKAA
ncbi:hypothetical protein [Desulfatibacillum aliphaticivorans]|uniref:hypothetical protein n=1 Tax=Desulfatibacillum aliphaticivorans TaxID=218208 RepID=UPI001471ACCD|nr:hypothetical protein [Desulfatibacillum aliphaticivorans]